jgi:hypothetical protein
MDNKTKIKIGIGLLLGVILFSSFKKPKKTSRIIIDDAVTNKSADADFLVLIKKGAKLKSVTDGTETTMQSDAKYDGFDTNELPIKVKVRDGLGKYFYAFSPDFKLL